VNKLVVDASVGVKWLLDEVLSAEAEAILDSDHELIVPELFAIEVANVFWRKARSGDLSHAEAAGCFQDFVEIVRLRLRVMGSAPVQRDALKIASETGRTVYDSIYLALAISEACKLVTADEKFVNGLKATAYADRARWLGAPT
jgi:predicted nucleic acid-binding protein